MDEQVTPFDQFGAHLPGEEGMLKISGIVDSAGQDHDDGVSVLPGARASRVSKR
jgi:hypothetical protein